MMAMGLIERGLPFSARRKQTAKDAWLVCVPESVNRLLECGFGIRGGGFIPGEARQASRKGGHRDDGREGEAGYKAGHAAKVVEEGATHAAGEEGAAAHGMEMEEGRDGGKDADGQGGWRGSGCPGGAVGEPVKSQGKPGNAEDDGQVAQQAGTKGQGPLLHAGVKARGKSDIGHFDQNDKEAAAQAGARHGRQVDQGAGSCAEQGAFPVPAGASPRQDERAAGRIHAFMVEDAPPMQYQEGVTAGFRLAAYRNQVDSSHSVIRVTAGKRKAR